MASQPCSAKSPDKPVASHQLFALIDRLEASRPFDVENVSTSLGCKIRPVVMASGHPSDQFFESVEGTCPVPLSNVEVSVSKGRTEFRGAVSFSLSAASGAVTVASVKSKYGKPDQIDRYPVKDLPMSMQPLCWIYKRKWGELIFRAADKKKVSEIGLTGYPVAVTSP